MIKFKHWVYHQQIGRVGNTHVALHVWFGYFAFFQWNGKWIMSRYFNKESIR